MNLKERGITVGDLLLILIFTFSTIFIINQVKKSDNQAYIFNVPNGIYSTKNLNY